MKKIPEKPTFALRLDGRLKEALDNAAATFGVSTAELIRTILARMMGLQNEMDIVLGRRIEALGREAIEAEMAAVQAAKPALLDAVRAAQ